MNLIHLQSKAFAGEEITDKEWLMLVGHDASFHEKAPSHKILCTHPAYVGIRYTSLALRALKRLSTKPAFRLAAEREITRRDNKSPDIDGSEILITQHAIDRCSQLLMNQYLAENSGEGICTWLKSVAQQCLLQGERDKDSIIYRNMRFYYIYLNEGNRRNVMKLTSIAANNCNHRAQA